MSPKVDAQPRRVPNPIYLSIFIVALAALLRLLWINELPPGFYLDESYQGLEAWRILTDPTYHPLSFHGNFGPLPLNAYSNVLTFAIFERIGAPLGPTAMRTTTAILGTITVAAMVPLAHELRKLDGRLSWAFPLFAAATLAVMRWHIHFSRIAIESIFVPLVWTGCTGFFLRGWRLNSWISFMGSGLVLGLGMYTYRGAWVIPFIMVLITALLLTQSWRQNSLERNKFYGPLLSAGIAFIVIIPLAIFFVRNPELFFTRLTQVSIVGETGSPADDSVRQNLWAMLQMFGPMNGVGDIDPRRNLPGAPALNLWLAIPFYFGLLLTFLRINRPAFTIPLISLPILLAPGVFSEYAPHFHRVFGAAAPTAILCAFGLDQLWQWQPARAQFVHWAAVALLVFGGFVGGYNYFVRWASLPDLFHAFEAGLWEIGTSASTDPQGTTFLTPRSLDHPTLAFALRNVDPQNQPIGFDGRHIFPLVNEPTDRQTYISIDHEDFRTQLLLPGVFPNAIIEHQMSGATADEQYATFTVRTPDQPNERPPQIPRNATLGDGINLVGYDVQPETLTPGSILYLQLHWDTTAAPEQNWTTFTHLLRKNDDGSETLVAGKDAPPGNGSLITTRWRAGWRILDEYQIALPADLAAGEYHLRVGLYQSTGERLPVDSVGVELGTVEIK